MKYKKKAPESTKQQNDSNLGQNSHVQDTLILMNALFGKK